MQPTTMLPKLSDATQTISFSEGDGVCSAEVYSTDVVVTTNAGKHDHGSSKVKLKNLVDYNWEPKYYSGQLLAIHMSGKYLAYCIKAPNAVNPGTWTGMVRVVYNPEPATDKRALIKGMKGEVQDLAFAHIQNQVILACIDEQGNFYVHEIEVTDSGLRCTLIAEIRDDTGVAGAGHRVVWCPYIPDDDDEGPDEDVSKLLLTTHANIARMWNVGAVARCVGADRVGRAGALAASGAARVVRAHANHAAPVVAAAFSPDGTALATASMDGYVMFFQVYMHNDSSPRCLHKWQPHSGKPLSCLFFLDNHNNYNSDVQFWKFAVTGADNNTNIKIWSCKSWECLQTITFSPGIATEPSMGLKAMLDRSATYLLLSDFNSRTLYVLNMAHNADDTVAYCRTISEFLLPYPVLSFCIVDAEEQQVKCSSRCDDPYHRNGSSGDIAQSPDNFDLHHDDEDEAGGSWRCSRRVCLRLYIVQPKGLQEGRLTYTPSLQDALVPGLSDLTLEDKSPEDTPALAASILQQQSQQLKNLLLRAQQPQTSGLIPPHPESPTGAPQLNLMTPDAFSSPGKREDDDPPLAATPDITGKSRNSTTGVCEDAVGGGGGGGKMTSGGSSPSREVQEIMGHNTDYYKEEAIEDPIPSEAESTGGALIDVDVEVDVGDVNGDAIYEVDIMFPAQETEVCQPNLNSSNTSWPAISLEQLTEANHRATETVPTAPPALPPPPPAPRTPPIAVPVLPSADRARLESLEHKLDKLTELIEAQSVELRRLRARSPRAAMEEVLSAHAQRTQDAVENALAQGWERITTMSESMGTRAAATAGAGAARALEPLARALQHELAAKLSATDSLLQENIEKLANSKTITDRLSTSIAKSVSEMVKESFRSALFESVVPVMEKAHAQIFRQINHAFQNGTKEFAANTEAAARAAAERGGAAATAALRAALDRHAEALANTPQPPPIHHITNAVKDATHSVLEKEMSWWRDQARSLAVQMSRAHSPATPSVADRQKPHRTVPRNCIQESIPYLIQVQVAQIQSLISAGDVNGAFQLALSASDLALVVAACRAAEPARVFGPPCQLKQHVLLSLVQQLAADMARDTALKHRYLEEAVMNLDTSSPVTREHLPSVVRELQKQLVAFLQATPQHALARQFRMLLMATDSLLKAA